jgi:hypothetical protein
MTEYRSMFAPERSVAECLWLWPTVIIRAPKGSMDADFADRIMQQSARPKWEPSPMQLEMMRRVVKTHVPDGIRLDPDLIEGATIGWTEEDVEGGEK